MVWYAWLIVIVLIFDIGATWGVIGREKTQKTYTVSNAVVTTVIFGLLVWAIISLATH